MKSTGWLFGLVLVLAPALLEPLNAGVSKEIEMEYRSRYENKAMFLRVPLRGARQVAYVRGGKVILDQASLAEPLFFKVGEQVRILEVKFRDTSVEFRVSSIDTTRRSALVFQFPDSLDYSFPRKESFDQALAYSFTEGLSYQEIDRAKQDFLQDQFDRLVQQFANTTGSSPEFVIQAISEKSPVYQKTASDLAEAKKRLLDAETKLRDLQDSNQSLEARMIKLRGELNELRRSSAASRRERDALAEDKNSLQQEVARLKRENAGFRQQISGMADKLDVELDSKSKLSNQVGSLARNIEELKQERTRLSGELKTATEDLEKVKKERDRLSRDLRSTRRKVSRLQSDLDALTSNRDSLEASYLRTKRSKENLERATATERAINLRPSDAAAEDSQIMDVYLLSKKIATLEATLPEHPGDEARVRFRVESPDTVEFTEEERRLYEALGEKFRVAVSWKSESDSLKPVLVAGEQVQEIAPREEAEWVWNMTGEISAPEPIAIQASLIDIDDQDIPVMEKTVELSSAGILPFLRNHFSLLSLSAGILMGLVGGLAVAKARQRPAALKRAADGPSGGYAVQKRL